VNQSLVLVYAIYHQGSTSPHIVDALIRKLLYAGGLHNDIKAVWVIVLEFLPLRIGVLAVKLDVFIPCIQALRNVHLDTFVSGNHDAGGTVLLKKLCEDETSWASAQKEDFDANARAELVESMNCACSRLKKSGLFIGEVVDLVKFLLLAVIERIDSEMGSMRYGGGTY
jgi:hypothetical protein